jgi:geranylgeranyl pyrophosphate synthase
MSIETILKTYIAQVDTALDHWLPTATTAPTRLHEAMRYAVLGPGKRVRPVLVYATGQIFETPLAQLDASAVAVELIHAYSLIHDDLPAMDNDDLRRGRPTCHRAYDEATAMLAGDALQALAFYVLANDPKVKCTPAVRIQMLELLAYASGSCGMAGGQAIDLAAVGKALTLAELENMHLHKTGALIRASVRLGFLAAQQDSMNFSERLDIYARNIGLAFQVQDDILDVEGATEIIGKPQGSDQDRDKPTYPNLLGMAGAKATARELCDNAVAALDCFGCTADPLRWLAEYIVKRDR